MDDVAPSVRHDAQGRRTVPPTDQAGGPPTGITGHSKSFTGFVAIVSMPVAA